MLLIFSLLFGSAMVAMFVTPLWCNEELFVVKSSEVLIMMVSKLAQAAAAALDTKSAASPDVSWFPLQAPSLASCINVDYETCLFHVLILSVPKFLAGRISFFLKFVFRVSLWKVNVTVLWSIKKFNSCGNITSLVSLGAGRILCLFLLFTVPVV